MSVNLSTRREFLQAAGLVAAAASSDVRFGLNVRPGRAAHDLVIRGGTV